MTEFMLTIFLGNIFVMAITILLIGFMFVLRVMLNIRMVQEGGRESEEETGGDGRKRADSIIRG